MIDSLKDEEYLIYSEESEYGKLQVYRYQKENSAYLSYRPFLDYEHSGLYPNEPTKDQVGLSYITHAWADGCTNYLILGSAAGGNIRQLTAINPDVSITAVEINPRAIELSKKFFGVEETDRVKLIAQDARKFLLENDTLFDCIIVDLFEGDKLPLHCITKEFFELVFNHLSSTGMMVINSNMSELHYPFEHFFEVPRPCRHLQSTIFNAGFKSIYQNDIHSLGIMYAFKERILPERFYSTLYSAYLKETGDAHLKAAVGAAILKSVRIPEERIHLRPYTIDWTPAELVYLKSNRRNISLAISKCVNDEIMSRITSGINTEGIAYITLKLIFSTWKDGKSGFDVGLDKYFSEIAEFISNTGEFDLVKVSKYVPLSDNFNSSVLQDRHNPAVETLLNYIEALNLVKQDRGTEAAPQMDKALDAISRFFKFITY